MKKAFCLLLCLALSCLSLTALAQGELEVAQTSLQAYEIDGENYAYCFAQVVNHSDEYMQYSKLTFDVLDAEGNVIATEEYASSAPYVLAPGAYGYVYAALYDFEGTPAEVRLSAQGTPCEERVSTITAKPGIEIADDDFWGISTWYLTGTVTNDTEETLYDINTVLALKDAEGCLLYVENLSAYDIGLLPGSSIVFRTQLPFSLMERLKAGGVKPEETTPDAIAYIILY